MWRTNVLSSSRVTLPLQAVFWGVGEKRGGEAHSVTAMLEWVRLYVLQYSFHLRNLRLTPSTGFSHACFGTPALSWPFLINRHSERRWQQLVFPLSKTKFLFPFQTHDQDNLMMRADSVLPPHQEHQQTAEWEFSFQRGNLLFQQDRNRPVHEWVPRPSGSSQLTWLLPAHPVLDKTPSYMHSWPQRASPTPRQVSYDWRRGKKTQHHQQEKIGSNNQKKK